MRILVRVMELVVIYPTPFQMKRIAIVSTIATLWMKFLAMIVANLVWDTIQRFPDAIGRIKFPDVRKSKRMSFGVVDLIVQDIFLGNSSKVEID